MSPKTRVALTFLLVVLAVAIWGVSQLPVQYDRSALGGSERLFAAALFMLAVALNLKGLARSPKKRRHAEPLDYYVHFDQPGHPPAAHPAPQPQHAAGHHGQPAHAVSHDHRGHDHRGHDHHYDRRL